MLGVWCDRRRIDGFAGEPVGQALVDVPVMPFGGAHREHHVAQRRLE
jgi:hypothetical protein